MSSCSARLRSVMFSIMATTRNGASPSRCSATARTWAHSEPPVLVVQRASRTKDSRSPATVSASSSSTVWRCSAMRCALKREPTSSSAVAPSICSSAGLTSTATPSASRRRMPSDAPSNRVRKRAMAWAWARRASNSATRLTPAERTTDSISRVLRSSSERRSVSELLITLRVPMTSTPLNSGTQISEVSPTLLRSSWLMRWSVRVSSTSSGSPLSIA